MSMQKRSFQLNDFLNHVVEASDRIDDYTAGLTYIDFFRSTRDQDAVIRNFEAIGEACNNIDKNFPDSPRPIPNARYGPPITCAMRCRMDTSALTSICVASDSQDLPSLRRNILAAMPPVE